jgi:hypothetical protein
LSGLAFYLVYPGPRLPNPRGEKPALVRFKISSGHPKRATPTAARFSSIPSVPCVFTQRMWVEPRFARLIRNQEAGNLDVVSRLLIVAVVASAEAVADNLDEFI